jgi:hypothetical protein
MTLPASGAISFSNIDTELGLSATAQISLNCSAVRTLFGQASGAICMNTGHGKSYVTVPGAPTCVSASAVTYSSASVSFSAPACTGHTTIDYYQAISSPGCVTATGSSPITVSSLSACTTYTFRVRAHNSAGYGSYSSSSGSITTPSNYVSHSWLVGMAGDTSTYACSSGAWLSSQGIIFDPNSNGKVVTLSYGICSQPYGAGYLMIGNAFNKDSGATLFKKKLGLYTCDNRNNYFPGPSNITTNYAYYGNVGSTGGTYDNNYFYFQLVNYTNTFNYGKSFGLIQTDKSLNVNNATYYTYVPSCAYYSNNCSYNAKMFAGVLIPNSCGSGMSVYAQGYWNKQFSYTYCCCGSTQTGTGYTAYGSPILANFNTSLSNTGAWTYSNVGKTNQRNMSGFTRDSSSYYMGVTSDVAGNNYTIGIIKVSSSNPSSVSWSYKFTTAGTLISDMKADGSGNLYVSGQTASGYLFLVKLDSSGSITWQRQVSVASGSVQTMDLDSSGNIYITNAGTTYGYTGALAVYKWNSSGTLQWQRVITGPYYYQYGYRYGSSTAYLKVYGDTFFIQTDWQNQNPGNFSSVTSPYVLTYLFRLPNDGSRTSTYTITNYGTNWNFTYQSSSFTETSGSLSLTSFSTSGSSVSLSANYHTSGPSAYNATNNSCISSLVSIY